MDGEAAVEAGVSFGLEPRSDGRYLINLDATLDSDELDATDLTTDLFASASAELPFYFPTDDLPLGGSSEDLDGNGVPDNVLRMGIDFGDTGSGSYGITNTEIVSPNLFSASAIFGLLNDPQNIIDGLNAMFNGMKGTLTTQFSSLGLPLLGNALQGATGFIDDLRDDVVGSFNDLLAPGIAAGKTTIEILQEGIFKGIGYLLVSDPGNNQALQSLISKVDHDDLLSRLASTDNTIKAAAEAELATRAKDIDLVLGEDSIQLNVLFGDVFSLAEVPLDFSAAIPALGFEIRFRYED